MRSANVYIVHLWSDGGARAIFRASVQRAGTDESAWFTEAATLARYFDEQAGAVANADEGARDRESP
jgi:hypothetical protein